MRICLIAEGSFPYVAGGVSSWITSLVSEMPEHDFIIFAIGAEEAQKGKFKCALPPNIIEVHEFFLDAHRGGKSKWGQRYSLSEQEFETLSAFLRGERTLQWESLFKLLRSDKFKSPMDFLSSKDYFDIIEEIARDSYPTVPFTELFWTINSMILPLLLAARTELPEADVYHAVSTGYAGVIGALAKYLYGKPLLLTEHGIYSREREEEIIKAGWVEGHFKDLWINYFYTLSAAAYTFADQVITLFERNREIEIELGCAPEKIDVIPNGIESLSSVIAAVKPDSDVIRIGAIVRVVPIKDIKTMIQSFAIVEKELHNVHLYIMGPLDENLEYYDECLSLCQALQVQRVHFTGMVSIQEWLPKLDILLLTSISEGQPLAILEGMAAKKPFVVTNVGSCKELMEGKESDDFGPAGIVTAVMHTEQIAKAILKLCENPKMRTAMGENGYQRVSRDYRKETFIEGYRGLYETIGGD